MEDPAPDITPSAWFMTSVLSGLLLVAPESTRRANVVCPRKSRRTSARVVFGNLWMRTCCYEPIIHSHVKILAQIYVL